MYKKYFTAEASRIAITAACMAIVASSMLYSQELSTSSHRISAEGGGGVSSSGASYSIFPLAPNAPMSGIVDNSIDEKAYYVGGGDVFHVFVVDLPSMHYVAAVNQNCDLIIPTLGIIPLGKVSLARAKEIIADYMHKKMRKPNEIRVVLEGIKNCTIYAFGAVTNPGTYNFYGITRLWDVLRTVSSGSFSDNNYRAIRRINHDSTTYFDLFAFLYKGDFSQNPYIYPGDQIYVFPALNRVFITGSGLRGWLSGLVPIHPNEAAADFLSHFVFTENADSEHIYIQRTDDNIHYQLVTFNMKQNQIFHLKNMDMISVPLRQEYPQICIGSVTGEVNRPGSYPITKNGTSAQALIAMGGGYTAFADTVRVAILRRAKAAPPIIAAASKSDPEAAIRPEMGASFGLTNTTKDFQVIKIKEPLDVTLEPGDQILVPRAEHMVYVSGMVKHPGGYPFKLLQRKEYYIRLAGGYTERVDKGNISVFSFFGDVTQTKSVNADIEDGDMIVVPLSREFKFFSMVILPSLSIVLASAGVLIGIMAMKK